MIAHDRWESKSPALRVFDRDREVWFLLPTTAIRAVHESFPVHPWCPHADGVTFHVDGIPLVPYIHVEAALSEVERALTTRIDSSLGNVRPAPMP